MKALLSSKLPLVYRQQAITVRSRWIHADNKQKIPTTYEDPVLSWARANPTLAQACLDPPAPPTNLLPCESLDSFESYWNEREWKFADPRGADLVTHTLSAPLTIARFLTNLVEGRHIQSIAIVGARAESSLPLVYWQELLYVTTDLHSLHFFGIELTRHPDQQLVHGDCSLQLVWHAPGAYHTHQDRLHVDTYVLLNPGLGHPHLRDSWTPTLQCIRNQNVPVLTTAHSIVDAERDASVWSSLYETQVQYSENPHASRIQYQDPLDLSHMVRPNCMAAVLLPRHDEHLTA